MQLYHNFLPAANPEKMPFEIENEFSWCFLPFSLFFSLFQNNSENGFASFECAETVVLSDEKILILLFSVCARMNLLRGRGGTAGSLQYHSTNIVRETAWYVY